MNNAEAVPSRSGWLVIAFSVAMVPIVAGFIITQIFADGATPAAPDMHVPRTLFRSAAAAVVVASMLWTQLRLRAPIHGTTRAQPPRELLAIIEFQSRSVVSLALAWAACVLGVVQAFLYRTPLREYLPFGAATLLVVVLDIVPIGLEYWSSREA